MISENKHEVARIKAGELFLLPANVPPLFTGAALFCLAKRARLSPE